MRHEDHGRDIQDILASPDPVRQLVSHSAPKNIPDSEVVGAWRRVGVHLFSEKGQLL